MKRSPSPFALTQPPWVAILLLVTLTGCTPSPITPWDVSSDDIPLDTSFSGDADDAASDTLDVQPIDTAQNDTQIDTGAEDTFGDTKQLPDSATPDSATPDSSEPDTSPKGYPMDDQLAFNHIQALGTHNSYHVKPLVPVPQWLYTHLPLDEQLGKQGVRQFELDLNYDKGKGTFEVYHVVVLDPNTNCKTFTDCISTMKGWSDLNPGHHPLMVLLEIKGGYDDGTIPAMFANLEKLILNVWPKDRLVTPDMVQGDAANLRDALAEKGWPTLGALRGRVLFVLHDDDKLRNYYTQDKTTTDGRLLFPDAYGNLDLPVAAYHSMNGPIGGFDAIQAVVNAGHLVRTRADSDSEEANNVDYSRYEAALASGAQFISTDYPFPGDDENYGVTIPDGTPSRCNPLTAPDGCTPLALEDPDLLAP